MFSLRVRLLALWVMLVASALVTGFLLLEFYRQSANAQVNQTEEEAARACREIGDRYSFFFAGLQDVSPASIDDELKRGLAGVLNAALARLGGVEGGLWQARLGSLAYAFPTYEGSGPKTDLPPAELATIRQVNADALRNERPVTVRQMGQSQVLIVHACPLAGPIEGVSAWTMARAFTVQGRAYSQLLIGLAVLATTVLGSAAWLGLFLMNWSRKLGRLQTALAARESISGDLPTLQPTGERELDRLVNALNAAGARLSESRRRTTAAERLAAVGRLAAGITHEIRNPIAAMRLKAENALAMRDDDRTGAALSFILEQIERLDGLLRDLLAMTQHRAIDLKPVGVTALLNSTVAAHRELAASKRIELTLGDVDCTPDRLMLDADRLRRALDNLILNAIENTPPGGRVTLEAWHDGTSLRLRVEDTGPGVPADIRERLFEPFVTGRADGTGLGLAMVRETVEAHGGTVRLVGSEQGAAFEIELPWRSS